MNNSEAIQKLSEATQGVLAGNNFAASLVSQHRRSGGLSEKQWPWVHKLLQPAKAPQPGFPRIPEIFNKAGEHLKWPKITVCHWHGAEIDTIKFSRAGERSRYAGQIQIMSDGYYEERSYYGRIDQDGNFHAARETHPELAEILVSMNTSLEDFAYQQGQASGNCIFCSNKLSDDRSLTTGYGPTCASNYSLPWGKPKDEKGKSK